MRTGLPPVPADGVPTVGTICDLPGKNAVAMDLLFGCILFFLLACISLRPMNCPVESKRSSYDSRSSVGKERLVTVLLLNAAFRLIAS